MKSGSVRQAAGSPTPTLLARPAVSGFTLIELSIVLVIIGFIVGGVVVGQNLIHQSQIRATLTQIGKLNTAVNTFSAKFGGLPGDLLNYNAVGMAVPSSDSATPINNFVGNGLIEDCTGNGLLFCGEPTAFLVDLSRAQLLDNNNISQVFTGGAGCPYTGKPIATYVIPSAFGSATFLWAESTKGDGFGLPANIVNYNYWHLGQISSIDCFPFINETFVITPVDAAGIDNKIDDGIPNTGNVLATDFGTMNLIPGAGLCSSAAGVYDVVANPTKGECSLAIRTGF
jgi:prepilin-type N-terminal cleavage/methylation domain-containing protein